MNPDYTDPPRSGEPDDFDITPIAGWVVWDRERKRPYAGRIYYLWPSALKACSRLHMAERYELRALIPLEAATQ